MAINNIANSVRTSMCDAFVDAIDGGTGAGIIQIFTTGFGSELAKLTFSDPAFGAASNGVATASAITDDSSAVGGVAAVFRVSTTNDGVTPLTTLYEGTVGTSGADINFNTTTFSGGDAVSITSMTITMPAS